MNTYLIRIKVCGLQSGYFSGEELTVNKTQLDRLKETNTVEILQEIKPITKSTPIKKK
ncbi:hypothetical protein [Algoriphagus aquimarinus]|uniref:hypothetical protein n=1 Tax=Algoriphagus aquimarinus TaxID=237018 RepID=UPI0030DCF57B